MQWSSAPEQPRSPQHRHWHRQDLGHCSMHAGKGSPRHSPESDVTWVCRGCRPFLALPCLLDSGERVPSTRSGLLSQSIVFRQEQPPHEVSKPRRGQPAGAPWEMGSEQKKRVCVLRPRGSPCFLPGAALELDPSLGHGAPTLTPQAGGSEPLNRKPLAHF